MTQTSRRSEREHAKASKWDGAFPHAAISAKETASASETSDIPPGFKLDPEQHSGPRGRNLPPTLDHPELRMVISVCMRLCRTRELIKEA